MVTIFLSIFQELLIACRGLYIDFRWRTYVAVAYVRDAPKTGLYISVNAHRLSLWTLAPKDTSVSICRQLARVDSVLSLGAATRSGPHAWLERWQFLWLFVLMADWLVLYSGGFVATK